MAGCNYSSINRYRYLGDEEETASKCSFPAESLRDKILKKILEKQLSKNFEVGEVLNNKDKFVSSSTQINVTSQASGLKSLKIFKSISDKLDLQETLSLCQFDSQEVAYLLRGNGTLNCEQLEAIENKLQKRLKDLTNEDPESFSGAVPLNRHEYEEECKYLAAGEVEKMTPCLVKLQPQSRSDLHPDHPINSICELEKELFPPHSPSRKPSKKLKLTTHPQHIFKCKPKTFWDMKEIPVVKEDKGPVQGCEEQPRKLKKPITVNVVEPRVKKTDFTKPFVWTLNPDQHIPLDEITSNKAPLSSILKDPKFSDYNPGKPSKTLFLKNLPRNMDPLLIVRLFGRFEDDNLPKIEYRILGGRMKGQAFVKFGDETKSLLALNTCHGYILQEKPIIIEFGKSS